MIKQFSKTVVLALSVLGFASQASATLIVESYASGTATPGTIGGYTMTDFNLLAGTTGDAITSIASPISGNVGLSNQYGNPVSLGFADSTSWWVNGESTDSNIFTTSTRRITITLPENTFAFSFNVGANKGAGAWFDAYETGGNVIRKSGISLSASNTPGFGVYADHSNGSCSSISSIVVDPSLIWGVGNFSISQGTCGTKNVPEPSSVALLALGLIGLGVIRKKQL